MKSGSKRSIAITMIVALAAGMLAGCGTKEKNDGDRYVWVPEYIAAGNPGENGNIRDVSVMGDYLYYNYTTWKSENYVSTTRAELRKQSINDLSKEPTVLYSYEEVYNYDTEEEDTVEDGELVTYVDRMFADSDDTVWLVQRTYPSFSQYDDNTYQYVMQNTTYTLEAYKGEEQKCRTEFPGEFAMNENFYISELMVTENTLFFVLGSGDILMFDKSGNYTGSCTSTLNWINNVAVLPDGRAAVAGYGNAGMEVYAYNASTRSFSDKLAGIPERANRMGNGFDGGLLVSGEDVSNVDLKTGENTELFKWIDCDINYDSIMAITAIDKENILAVYEDWSGDEGTQFVLLHRKTAREAGIKKELTLAVFYVDQQIQEQVVNFNKNSEDYRIKIIDYSEAVDWNSENAEQAYDEAQEKFQNDLMAGTGADLFDATNANLAIMAQKGVVEDLTPYLEKSQLAGKDDILGNVLEAYTESGILCAIPIAFNLQTLFGRSSEVGSEPGWTLEEMVAFAENHSDEKLFAYMTRTGMLGTLVEYGADSFVNWETGECFFDTEGFKKVLQLSATYDAEYDYNNMESEVSLIRNHKVSLYSAYLYDFREYQTARMIYGEAVTPIGYPMPEGGGTLVRGSGAICINKSSKNKDAAWAFIESGLTREAQKEMWYGLPVRKDVMEEKLAEAMEKEYQLDAKGEPVLDENGNPIEIPAYVMGWDDVTFEMYAITEEEADEIRRLLAAATTRTMEDEGLFKIIMEEAESYFAGQKSVDDVASVIQSRASIYVNESR